jgi:serine/threonine protein kinase/Flp pilus assembly protein TadD
MTEPSAVADVSAESLLAQVTDEFLERQARGEQPDIEDYAARYPDLASVLRPTLAALRLVAGSPAPPDADGEPQILGTLGDFRILREVGRGGMGIVYEAEQISLGRRVALKVLPFAATMDSRQLQRFKNEAHAAAQLHHTNIVPVYSVGCERGVHYYAMQFIEGHSLAEVIAGLRRNDECRMTNDERMTNDQSRKGPPDTPQGAVGTEVRHSTLDILSSFVIGHSSFSRRDSSFFRAIAEFGIQAAEALDYAHEHGIIHRDIKPANLLVDADSRLWITDFGLAQVQGDARMTMTGDLVGTLRYMSPEQALAKRVVIDHRTDVYSLGASLYELLTLEPAFGGTDRQELLRQIAFEEPRKPRKLNRSIPLELETIVLKALEKNPADRYATAKELADDLRHWMEDKPIRARRATLLQQARKWSRRHRAAVWSAAAILIVSSLVLAGTLGWEARDRAARRLATAQAVGQALDESQNWQQERRIPEALNAARRAEGIALGGLADGELQLRVRARVTDLELLERLENARLEMTAIKDHHTDWGRADASYEKILRDWGLDLEQLSPEKAQEIIRGSSVAVELAAVLDHWAIVHLAAIGEADLIWRKILPVAQAADPHNWRNQVRDALRQLDAKKLADLVKPADVDRLLPPTMAAVTYLLLKGSHPHLVEPLLREAQRQRPTDYWNNHYLAVFLVVSAQPPRVEEAIRFFTAALVLRPHSPGVHFNLGLVLKKNGQLDEAVAEFRVAVALKRDWAEAHYMLGSVLKDKVQLEEAITEFREALRIKESYADAHLRLGMALFLKGRLDESIAEYRQAIRFKGSDPTAHYNLGISLAKNNQVQEAVAEYREALKIKDDFADAHCELGMTLNALGGHDQAMAEFRKALRIKKDYADAHVGLGNVLVSKHLLEEAIAEFRAALGSNKDHFEAHHNLGSALCRAGKLDEGITAFHEAIRIKEDNADAHCNLGHALRALGQFAEALAASKRGHELGSRDKRWTNPSDQWVRECEALLELDRRLPAILSGSQQPRDATEGIGFAELCQMPCKKRYLAAHRFYEQAFAADPKLTGDQPSDARYNAACAAALAGCGQGKDADQTDDKERVRLRRQALDWLRADLAAYRKLLAKEPDKIGPVVNERMQQWLADKDFAHVRGSEALDKLPEAERREWQKLWSEVDELRQKVAKPAK